MLTAVLLLANNLVLAENVRLGRRRNKVCLYFNSNNAKCRYSSRSLSLKNLKSHTIHCIRSFNFQGPTEVVKISEEFSAGHESALDKEVGNSNKKSQFYPMQFQYRKILTQLAPNRIIAHRSTSTKFGIDCFRAWWNPCLPELRLTSLLQSLANA